MARRRREDYQPPSRKQRAKRPTPPPSAPAAAAPAAFPPGTWKKVLVGGLLGAVALSSLAWFVLDRQRDERRLATALLAGGTCETDTRSDPSEGGHVDDPVFRVNPPAGGRHTEEWAKAGVYAGHDVPPDGELVHALEHGYVVLWHRPDVDPAPLAALAREHEGDVIVAERASLPVPVAATAWERRLLCQRVEPTALELFVDAYVGEGPEDVERG